MKRWPLAVAVVSVFAITLPVLAAGIGAPAVALPSAASLATARGLRDRALTDDTGYEMLRSLTTEVGARSAGSPGDLRAVSWALAKLKSMGFQNVHAESVTVPHWIRGDAQAEITAPWPQRRVAATLGGSIATPPGGIEAEVVRVNSLEELKLLRPEQVEGRIVFFGGHMTRTKDGSGYGTAVAFRSRGAAEAAKLGALAVVIRSIGTDHDRVAHTGGMRFEATEKHIPAMALSTPDADLLDQQLASGQPVRVKLRDDSQWADSTRSANVVGEIPGREKNGEVVVLGAHLDSWDLGTGAEDDGAGVAIMSAARLIGDLKTPPRRTIRVVLFANEEFGLSGARTYARDHAAEASHLVLGMESDLGPWWVYGFSSRVPPAKLPIIRALHAVIEPLGVEYLGNEATGDADVGQLYALGVPVFDLHTDATRYFDLHHTPNDTFDKIDPQQLRQNVACYSALAYLVAELDGDLGRAPRASEKPAR